MNNAMDNELKHEVNFYVPLTGSFLFDMHTRVTAQVICQNYPGLSINHEPENKRLYIVGKLNDYWYDKWCTDMFNKMGEH